MSDFERSIQAITQSAQTDQATASTRTLAQVVATYYSTLVMNGVPKGLAAELTTEYQNFFLVRAFGGTIE